MSRLIITSPIQSVTLSFERKLSLLLNERELFISEYKIYIEYIRYMLKVISPFLNDLNIFENSFFGGCVLNDKKHFHNIPLNSFIEAS